MWVWSLKRDSEYSRCSSTSKEASWGVLGISHREAPSKAQDSLIISFSWFGNDSVSLQMSWKRRPWSEMIPMRESGLLCLDLPNPDKRQKMDGWVWQQIIKHKKNIDFLHFYQSNANSTATYSLCCGTVFLQLGFIWLCSAPQGAYITHSFSRESIWHIPETVKELVKNVAFPS